MTTVTSKNIRDVVSVGYGYDFEEGLITGIQKPYWEWNLLNDMMESPLFRHSTLHLGLSYKDSVLQSEVDATSAYLNRVLPGCAARGTLCFEHADKVARRFNVYI